MAKLQQEKNEVFGQLGALKEKVSNFESAKNELSTTIKGVAQTQGLIGKLGLDKTNSLGVEEAKVLLREIGNFML